MRAKLVEDFTYLKPKSSEEIDKSLREVPLDQLVTLLYEKGMDFFDSSESDFVDFIYETLGRNEVYAKSVGKSIEKECHRYDDFPHSIPLNRIHDVVDFFNNCSSTFELHHILEVLTAEDIYLLLPLLTNF